MKTLDHTAAPRAAMSYLTELPPEWRPIHHAILADGSLAVLATDGDFPSHLGEQAPATRARIWAMPPDGPWSEGPTLAVASAYQRLDRFADGRWLVVDSLSREANARILSPEGTVLDCFGLGIGIEHLAIYQDRIWVGWDDQSVCSNGDFQIPGQEGADSAHAVVCFSEDGTPLFLPAWPEHGVFVVDPYTLSVDDAGAWSCPYMAALDYFPLVRFVPGVPTRWWRIDRKGSAAIATDGDHVALAGGYEADRLTLLALPSAGAGEQAPVLATWSMPRPSAAAGGTGASARATLLVGRGDTIHLVQDQVWYRWRVRDLVAA